MMMRRGVRPRVVARSELQCVAPFGDGHVEHCCCFLKVESE
jgi:hypothetical protein